MKTQEDDLLVYDEDEAVKFILNTLPADAKERIMMKKSSMCWMWFMNFMTKMV